MHSHNPQCGKNSPPLSLYFSLLSLFFFSFFQQLDIVTPYQLYFNPELIFKNFQVWRLITNFCYFGPIGFNFLFNMLFTYRYCRFLEEGSFRGRTADFLFMFLFGGFLMTVRHELFNFPHDKSHIHLSLSLLF